MIPRSRIPSSWGRSGGHPAPTARLHGRKNYLLRARRPFQCKTHFSRPRVLEYSISGHVAFKVQAPGHGHHIVNNCRRMIVVYNIILSQSFVIVVPKGQSYHMGLLFHGNFFERDDLIWVVRFEEIPMSRKNSRQDLRSRREFFLLVGNFPTFPNQYQYPFDQVGLMSVGDACLSLTISSELVFDPQLDQKQTSTPSFLHCRAKSGSRGPSPLNLSA